MKLLKKEMISEEFFQDVVVFMFSERFAMGPNNLTIYKQNGESFIVDYLSDKTPYSMIKQYFKALEGAYFNGPMEGESSTIEEVIIYVYPDSRKTSVAEGWKHIYLDVGNHLVIRKDVYPYVKEILEEADNITVTFYWTDILNKADFASLIRNLDS